MHPATSTSTHLHPSPPSSFQSPPRSIHLHPAQLSLHPALCNTLNVIRSLISHISDNFSKFRSKNSNLSILTENWQQKELEGGGFKSRLIFLKFGPQNPFSCQFGPKLSKLSVLPENLHTWYLDDVDSDSNISFLNLQP